MDLKSLKDLLKVLKSSHVTEYNDGQLSLKISEEAWAPKSDPTEATTDPIEREPTYEERLFYSSPNFIPDPGGENQ